MKRKGEGIAFLFFSCSPHEKKTNTMETIYAIVYLKVYVVP